MKHRCEDRESGFALLPSGFRAARFRLIVNLANLVVSLAVILSVLLCQLGAFPSFEPAPIVKLLAWYSGLTTLKLGSAVLVSLLALSSVLLGVLFSFKFHLEETAVMLLGIPFYISIAAVLFSVIGFLVECVRLIFGAAIKGAV